MASICLYVHVYMFWLYHMNISSWKLWNLICVIRLGYDHMFDEMFMVIWIASAITTQCKWYHH